MLCWHDDTLGGYSNIIINSKFVPWNYGFLVTREPCLNMPMTNKRIRRKTETQCLPIICNNNNGLAMYGIYYYVRTSSY